jgi:hypothetical protein
VTTNRTPASPVFALAHLRHRLALVCWLLSRSLARVGTLLITSTLLATLLTGALGCCGSKDKGTSRSFRAPSAAEGETPRASAEGSEAPSASASTAAVAPTAPRRPRSGLDVGLPGNVDRRARLAQSIARARLDPKGPAFASPTQLTAHFQKHGEAMGYDSETAYLAGAQHLIKNSEVSTLARGRDTLYFLASTGEFAVVSSRGQLRTYFVPNDPDGYWARQANGEVDREQEGVDRRRLRRPR